jgi:SepF-like predicted cell division protein (DUF552 family)
VYKHVYSQKKLRIGLNIYLCLFIFIHLIIHNYQSSTVANTEIVNDNIRYEDIYDNPDTIIHTNPDPNERIRNHIKNGENSQKIEQKNGSNHKGRIVQFSAPVIDSNANTRNLNKMNLSDDIEYYRNYVNQKKGNQENYVNDDDNDDNDNYVYIYDVNINKDNNYHEGNKGIYDKEENLTILTAREYYQKSLKINTKNDINRTYVSPKSDSLTNINLVQPTSPYDQKSNRTYVSTDSTLTPELNNFDKKTENKNNSTYRNTNRVELNILNDSTDVSTGDHNLKFNEETKEITEKNSTDVSTVNTQDEEDFLDDHSHLLIHVKDIRSEKQLTALIEYIQDGYISIENTDIEKKKLKKFIKGWNDTFENDNGRAATNQEKKSQVRDVYEDYQKVSSSLKARCDRVNDILEEVGLTHQGFLKLRDKYFEWQSQESNSS